MARCTTLGVAMLENSKAPGVESGRLARPLRGGRINLLEECPELRRVVRLNPEGEQTKRRGKVHGTAAGKSVLAFDETKD